MGPPPYHFPAPRRWDSVPSLCVSLRYLCRFIAKNAENNALLYRENAENNVLLYRENVENNMHPQKELLGAQSP